MGRLTDKMGLATWDQPLDDYDYQQLSNNWEIVDFHDHSPGRGVQIPRGGIAPEAIGPKELGSDAPTVPTGGIILWPVALPPGGFLVCDGSAYLISAYSALYGVIGTAYNVAPPSGYFNVPTLSLVPVYGAMHWVIKD